MSKYNLEYLVDNTFLSNMAENTLEYFINNTYLPSYSWCPKYDMLANILKKDYKIVKHLKYNIDHDGYDHYGPESDLHDIYIWYIKDDKYYIDSFHSEEWFHEGSRPIFEFHGTYEITSEQKWLNLIKFDNYDFIYKLNNYKRN